MRTLVAILGLSLLVTPAVSTLSAQYKKRQVQTERSLEGTVSDEQGKAIPGAVVHLKNMKTLQIRSFIAKDDGTYAFHGLSTNIDYEVKAEHEKRSSDTRTLSVFDSRAKAVINLKLK